MMFKENRIFLNDGWVRSLFNLVKLSIEGGKGVIGFCRDENVVIMDR